MPSRHLILAALFCFLAIAAVRDGVLVAPVLTGLWLCFGIGHGLFDAVLAARSWNVSFRTATVFYAAAAIAAATAAYRFPTITLGLHLLLSAYHFGQAEWGEPAREKFAQRALVLLWGTSLVAMMILGPWADAQNILAALLRENGVAAIRSVGQHRVAMMTSFGSVGLASALWLGGQNAPTDNRRAQRLLETGLLYVLFLTLPLWLSFPLYLSLWHGFRSLEEDVLPELRRRCALPSDRVSLALTVLVAAVTTATVLYVSWRMTPAVLRHHAYVGPVAFALLIAVTFPHAFVMACVARDKRRQPSVTTMT